MVPAGIHDLIPRAANRTSGTPSHASRFAMILLAVMSHFRPPSASLPWRAIGHLHQVLSGLSGPAVDTDDGRRIATEQRPTVRREHERCHKSIMIPRRDPHQGPCRDGPELDVVDHLLLEVGVSDPDSGIRQRLTVRRKRERPGGRGTGCFSRIDRMDNRTRSRPTASTS